MVRRPHRAAVGSEHLLELDIRERADLARLVLLVEALELDAREERHLLQRRQHLAGRTRTGRTPAAASLDRRRRRPAAAATAAAATAATAAGSHGGGGVCAPRAVGDARERQVGRLADTAAARRLQPVGAHRPRLEPPAARKGRFIGERVAARCRAVAQRCGDARRPPAERRHPPPREADRLPRQAVHQARRRLARRLRSRCGRLTPR
mmetsp:Transcript_56311/g.149675  ORF Transcript_56311/g.149675 Transcript_56311/m.149675 type:complete len:208 (+) Transcript_56311:860-1483(+)